MKRKRKRKQSNGLSDFEVIKHASDGRTWAVYLCRHCSRAWKYSDPIEAWRVNSLLSHAGIHGADKTVRAMLSSAAPDRAEG